MALTRNAGILFAVLLLAVPLIGPGGILYAQSAAPGQLGTEIQTIEQRLSSGISPAERHDALVRLAQLRQLSGNIAIAANNWLDAAAADPNDDAALVSGAYCLTAIGEWERAALIIQPLLAHIQQAPSMHALYLDAYLRTLASFNAATKNGDASALAALASNAEFAALRPMIYYTLWQITNRNPAIAGAGGAEVWKTRLLDEFPRSPEARSIHTDKQQDSPFISAVQSPLWLLFPGTAVAESATPTAPPAPIKPVDMAVPAEPPSKVVAINPAKPSSPAAEETPQAVGITQSPPAVSANTVAAAFTVVLQTGLFSKETNANAQLDALQRAGFAASISRKQVNGTEYWAVTVPSGQNENKTIADLKKAGFDSFPVK